MDSEIARNSVAFGLAAGALGSALVVATEGGGAQCAVSGRNGSHCSGIPDSIQISIGCDASGTARLDVRVWCESIHRRAVVIALLLGAAVATAGSLLFGWLITWSVPAAVGFALLSERLLWRRARRCVRGRIETMAHNVEFFANARPR